MRGSTRRPAPRGWTAILGLFVALWLGASCARQEEPAAGPLKEPGEQPGLLRIEMIDRAFAPDRLLVPAGRYTLILKNNGQENHEWILFAEGAEEPLVKSGDVKPGSVKLLQIELAPGSYRFECHEEGHLDSGMAGRLSVQ